MVSLYKDPTGEKVFKSNMGSQDTGVTLNTSKCIIIFCINFRTATAIIGILRKMIGKWVHALSLIPF